MSSSKRRHSSQNKSSASPKAKLGPLHVENSPKKVAAKPLLIENFEDRAQAQHLINYMTLKNRERVNFEPNKSYSYSFKKKNTQGKIVKETINFSVATPFHLVMHDSADPSKKNEKRFELLGREISEGLDGKGYFPDLVAKTSFDGKNQKVYDVVPSHKVTKLIKKKNIPANEQINNAHSEKENFYKFNPPAPTDKSVKRGTGKGSVSVFSGKSSNEYLGALHIKKIEGIAIKDLPEATSGIERLIYAYRLLDKLEYAHNQGIIHHDIKTTGNVLFDPDAVDAGFVDAGFAKNVTEKTTCRGSPDYMSPQKLQSYYMSKAYPQVGHFQEYDKSEDYQAVASVLAQLFIDKKIVQEADEEGNSPVPNVLLNYAQSIEYGDSPETPAAIKEILSAQSTLEQAIKKYEKQAARPGLSAIELTKLNAEIRPLQQEVDKQNILIAQQVLPLLNRKRQQLKGNAGYDFASVIFKGQVGTQYTVQEKNAIFSILKSLSIIDQPMKNLSKPKQRLAQLITHKIKHEQIWENLSIFIEQAKQRVQTRTSVLQKEKQLSDKEKLELSLLGELQRSFVKAETGIQKAKQTPDPIENWTQYRSIYKFVSTQVKKTCADEKIHQLNVFKNWFLEGLRKLVTPISKLFKSEHIAKFGVFRTDSANTILSVRKEFTNLSKSVPGSEAAEARVSLPSPRRSIN